MKWRPLRPRKRTLLVILLLLAWGAGGAIVNSAVAWGCVHPLRIERDAAVQAAPQQYVLHAPYSVGSWVFAELGQHGWPCATVQGIDGFHVLWRGFAINTLFYAVILWLLFAAPFALRRRMREDRIRRGLCPACAYPIGENPVCTECGEPLPSPSR